MARLILVVEDSRTQAERLRFLLEDQGYEVTLARHGQEGLQRLQEATPDLIISDIVMPVMDGYAFCQAVKSVEATRRIPFVFLTDRNRPADILLGLERGADNFITKPFEDPYLLERVQRIFEHLQLRQEGHVEAQIPVRVGGHELAISADKQQIIELLLATFAELHSARDKLVQTNQELVQLTQTLEERVVQRTVGLRESEARKAAILESALDCIVTINQEGQILEFNPAAEKTFGYTREAVIGRPMAELLIPPSLRESHRRGLTHYLATGDGPVLGKRLELTALRADGAEFPVEFAISAVALSEGRVFTAYLRDITERKLAEDTLRMRDEEMRTMSQQLWQAAKLATMGELAASIAHELNNPLATVSLRVEFLMAQIPRDDPKRHALDVVGQEVQRMGVLVANLLQFSRRNHPQLSSLDVREELENTLSLVQYHLRNHRITVIREWAPDVPLILADRQQLRQVFLNLITNASDAMPHSGTLTVHVAMGVLDTGAPAVVIEFVDTGIGITPEHMPKVMEPFFTTKEEGKGTGLGLAICRRIAQECHGIFDITSTVGQGTTVRLALPLHVPQERQK